MMLNVLIDNEVRLEQDYNNEDSTSSSTASSFSESAMEAMVQIDTVFHDPPPPVPASSFYGRVRQQIHRFLSEPGSSDSAYVFSIFVVTLIIFSTFTFCLETVNSLAHTPQQLYIWNCLETIIVAQFTSDYFLRLVTCEDVKKFLVDLLNLVDVAAIVPVWVELGLLLSTGPTTNPASLAAIRVLRMLRMLRMLKVARHSPRLKLLSVALYRSREGIFLLVFMLALSVTVFASAIFYAETAYCDFDPVSRTYVYANSTIAPGARSTYQSIFGSMWWAIVTISTVGYGDSYPVTDPGKVVATIAMLCGILVVSFPVTIISSNLNEVYYLYRRARHERRREKLLKRQAKQQSRTRALDQARFRAEMGESDQSGQNKVMLNPTVINMSMNIHLREIFESMRMIEYHTKKLKDAKKLLAGTRDHLTMYAEKYEGQRRATVIAASSTALRSALAAVHKDIVRTSLNIPSYSPSDLSPTRDTDEAVLGEGVEDYSIVAPDIDFDSSPPQAISTPQQSYREAAEQRLARFINLPSIEESLSTAPSLTAPSSTAPSSTALSATRFYLDGYPFLVDEYAATSSSLLSPSKTQSSTYLSTFDSSQTLSTTLPSRDILLPVTSIPLSDRKPLTNSASDTKDTGLSNPRRQVKSVTIVEPEAEPAPADQKSSARPPSSLRKARGKSVIDEESTQAPPSPTKTTSSLRNRKEKTVATSAIDVTSRRASTSSKPLADTPTSAQQAQTNSIDTINK